MIQLIGRGLRTNDPLPIIVEFPAIDKQQADENGS